ncbi:MAG: guanylate kinase [Bacteroidales bacterium]|jgi:guanylate kinase|nr:guanylate kinase [Bacteroidales bacterium]
MKEKYIIVSAPSGAGKTTIVQSLISKGLPLEFSISATSRPPRNNEINGKDYYFLNIDEFKNKIANNEFIEYEEVYPGLFYGTLKKEIDRIIADGKYPIFDVDVKGGLKLKNIFGENALAIFIKPPNIEELEKRLKNRNTENEETLKKRIERAKFELSMEPYFDVTIINEDLDKSINAAYDIVKDFLNKS